MAGKYLLSMESIKKCQIWSPNISMLICLAFSGLGFQIQTSSTYCFEKLVLRVFVWIFDFNNTRVIWILKNGFYSRIRNIVNSIFIFWILRFLRHLRRAFCILLIAWLQPSLPKMFSFLEAVVPGVL